MHLHILGICGTFMGGIAAIAKSLGHQVTGSDANVYPPMSTQLEELGISLTQGYDPAQLEPLCRVCAQSQYSLHFRTTVAGGNRAQRPLGLSGVGYPR